MKIITHFFTGQDTDYGRLFSVFQQSAKHHMPDVEIILVQTPPPSYPEQVPEGVSAVKYYHHIATAKAFLDICDYLPLNEDVAVCDADLMFTGSLESIWDYPFHIAFTSRNYKARFNTGIWFLRGNDTRSKDFVQKWNDNVLVLLGKFYNNQMREINKFAGIDQSALVRTLVKLKRSENPPIAKRISCQIWNATQSEWHLITDETKVIHIKSALRKHVLNNSDPLPEKSYLQPIINQWREYEKEAIKNPNSENQNEKGGNNG
jgi:lipopolysaccharide biosynthesis glycosyltransferase